uniref:VWFA domain-containing protein n=1 Tax=Haemonchus placei TaxID=6290 RepID=A0A158QN56_HAEPC
LEVCAAVHPDVYIPCTTQAPPATANPASYCNGFLNRDIVLLVDTLVSPMKDDKQAALKQVGAALTTGIPFGTGVRVAIVTLNGAVKVSDFVSDAASFTTAWAKLLALPFTDTAASIDVQPAYEVVKSLLSQQIPMEAIIISDHPLGAIDPVNDIRLKGVFVSAVVPTNVNLFGYDKLTTVKKAYPTWNAMAIVNPFSTLLCQYSDAPAPAPKALLVQSAQAATDDNPKCQKLDIIVVFDTSQSVVEPFIKKYVDFSKKFIAQYTLSGAVDGDNSRTGIISFSSDVSIVRNLGERSLDDFNAAVDGIHYTGGTSNTLAAMKAGRDMFKNSGGTTHGRTMVFLSDGQPYPLTPDTWTEIISVGSELKQMGVDIFFVGDDNGYDSDTRTVLSNITGNTNWVFNTTSDAMVNLTADLVVEFPCPPLICEMAYYAVELSEILSEQAKVQSLNFILQTAQNVYTAKNTTQFQLMVYNDMQ